MHGSAGDARSAIRGLRRAPAFSVGAITTLAVAIAVSTALFSFLNAIYFRALPYPDGGALHHVRAGRAAEGAWEAPRIGEMRAVLDGVAEIGAYRETPMVVAGTADEPPSRMPGTALEPSVLSLLRAAPVAGRLLEAGDGMPGAVPVIVLDEALATARFGGPAAAVGGVLRIDGIERTVVGVLPAGLAFPDFARFWIPLEAGATMRASAGVRLIARLAEGRRAEAVAGRLETLRTGERTRGIVLPLQPQAGGAAVAVLGAVAFLLLIACGNVANLVLARGTARTHELGVRAVLGASRGRLLRVLLAEGAVLAGAAALTGGILGAWLTEFVVRLIPADQVPLWFEARLDLHVLAWIAGAAAVATIVASGLPAIAITHGGLSSLLATGGLRGADRRGGRLRAVLVAAQLALATTLLAGAGLLARSFVDMRRADPGYAAGSVLQVETHRARVPATDTFLDDAIRALDALSGVAGAAARLPARTGWRVAVAGGPTVETRAEAVTPAFFDVLGLSIVRGRTFTPGEASAGRVALISASLAERLFGDIDGAVGRTVSAEPAEPFTVIGVTASRRDWFAGGLEGSTEAAHIYLPAAHGDPVAIELLVRSAAPDPLGIAGAVAERVRASAPDAVVRPPRTLVAVERERATDLRFFATLFSAFAALALALAALGIYGVVAYAVSRRTREIGVRVALGATTRRIGVLIARGVLPTVAAGLGLGLVGAVAVSRVLRGVLFGAAAGEPALLAAVIGIFAATALLAAWLPARRAARIDPVTALRME